MNKPRDGRVQRLATKIKPAYYNFVDVRDIGEPVLRERIYAPAQNATFVQNTVNVTNITVKNKTVYNYGPNIDVVNKVSTRPVQRLRGERASMDPRRPPRVARSPRCRVTGLSSPHRSGSESQSSWRLLRA